MKHLLFLWLASLLVGCGARPMGPSLEECEAEHAGGPATLLPVCVRTARGALAVEAEYVPGVVDCEMAGWSRAPAALEAQAVAARTYLLAHLLRRGPEAKVTLGASFQCWRKPRFQESRAAAEATRDAVLHRGAEVLDANYVSGTRYREADCSPASPRRAGYPYEDWTEMRAAYDEARRRGQRRPFSGRFWTEVLATRNEGKSGEDVVPTPFAPTRPSNRGAFGQFAAACLAKDAGYDAARILRYF